MRKIDNTSGKPFDCTVRDSLDTIRATHVRLHLLEGTCSTATLLTSRIELYDVLLDELSGIHSNLANYFEHAGKMPPASGRAGLNA